MGSPAWMVASPLLTLTRMALLEPALLMPKVAAAVMALLVVKASSWPSLLATALALGIADSSWVGRSAQGSAGFTVQLHHVTRVCGNTHES